MKLHGTTSISAGLRIACLGLACGAGLVGCERLPFSSASRASNLDSIKPTPRTDAQWVVREALLRGRVSHAGTNKSFAPPRAGTILFLGDSITEGWETSGLEPWTQAFAPRGAINLGISGDRTIHVLYRIQSMDLASLADITSHVVLLIGTNDLKTGATPQQSAAGVHACVLALRSALPHARVIVVEVLPRAAPDDPLRSLVASCNAHLRTLLAHEPNLTLIESQAAFIDGPADPIDPALMPDLLHLSPLGYERLAALLEPHMP